MQSFLHRPWSNHIEEQNITPEVTYLPSDLSDLINIVQIAEKKNSNVKACGSRHSWSAICPTHGRMVLPEALTGRLDLEIELLHGEAKLKKLVRVKSGTTIRALNTMLDAEGLAISWLGGFDGKPLQAFARHQHMECYWQRSTL
ncbi:MAG: FAD-binding protein [Saprospiraceae bacterium]|nr:FAD-binding protein [Saprospiraceae bacterium]